MIIVPKRFSEILLPSHVECAGYYKIEKYKADSFGQPIFDSKTVLADWFPNIITNQGLNRLGVASGYLTSCQVGSGTATPLATDTGMQTYVAGTGQNSSTGGVQSSPPYYGWARNVYRFNAGVATGNLSEVGVGWVATGNNLFSRSRILDGGGAPTTITVLSDEILDVTYEYRVFAPATDTTNNATITGVGTLTCTNRANRVTDTSRWRPDRNGDLASFNANFGFSCVSASALQAVTAVGDPANSNFNTTTATGTYVAASLQRVGTLTLPVGQVVPTGIVQMCQYAVNGLGSFQTQFSPTFTKLTTQQLVLNLQVSWARRP